MLPFTTYILPETPVDKTQWAGKQLLFVTQPLLTKDQEALLEKISSALNLNFSSHAVCLEWNENQSGPILASGFTSGIIISFGVKPSALGLWIDMTNTGIRFLETITFIFTVPLVQLESNAGMKKELWKLMQQYLETVKHDA